jgi:hypothetical protein
MIMGKLDDSNGLDMMMIMMMMMMMMMSNGIEIAFLYIFKKL